MKEAGGEDGGAESLEERKEAIRARIARMKEERRGSSGGGGGGRDGGESGVSSGKGGVSRSVSEVV